MDDRAALERFCADAHPPLVAALAHHCGDRWLAEECAQEALLRACARWAHVRELDSPVGWTFRVGANLANSHFRRRRAERRARQRIGPVPQVAEADPTTAMAVRQAMAGLTTRQREAIVLRYFLGLSADQTAHVLGLTPGAVRALTHRGVGALRTVLDLDDQEEVASDAR
jgi:RNA polymerase sigma factor (sigma-70 family)